MICIKITVNSVDCHLDLGSQRSLITLSKAKELNLDVVVTFRFQSSSPARYDDRISRSLKYNTNY